MILNGIMKTGMNCNKKTPAFNRRFFIILSLIIYFLHLHLKAFD